MSAASRHVTERQQTVRAHLAEQIAANDKTAPVAAALAVVLPDGSVQFSAVGIEREFAEPVADALDRVSTILRHHAVKPRRIDSQGGFAMLAPVVSMMFMAATYVNDVAWVDSALMLAGQLAVSWLISRTTNRPK